MLRQWFANWLLRGVKLREVHFGTHSVSISDRIVMSTVVPTAMGQIGMDAATGRPQAFVDGASRNLLHASDAAQLLAFGVLGVGVAGATRYLLPGAGVLSVSEAQLPVSRAGVLRNLRARGLVGPGVGAVDVITVRVNGVDTTLAASLTGAGAQAGADTTHAPVVAAGDLVSVKIVYGGLSVLADVLVSLELAPE